MAEFGLLSYMLLTLGIQSRYLADAETLADRLLNRAIITSKGLCWPSIASAYSKDRIVRHPNMTLASGNSGICLFLSETYRRTGNEDFLEAAIKATDWIDSECHKGNEGARSLWFGQLGGVEAQLALFEATGDRVFLEKARLLAIKCGEAYFNEDQSLGPIFSNIGSGAAGALLTLLRVFEKTQDEHSLELSGKLMRLLGWRVRLAPEGIYWDRLGATIRPPIGFITGTSGVLFALAEANKVLPFEACSWLLSQGILYENSFLKNDPANWPDLSHSTWSLEDLSNLPKKIRNALKKGDEAFFKEFGDSASWSNGCSGIALARSACSSFLDDDSCPEDIARAKRRIEQEVDLIPPSSEESDFSLASGLGGVGLACLGLYSKTGDVTFRDLAERIGAAALKQRQNLGFYRSSLKAIEDGEDMGFLTGSAGIGYFLLKLSDDNIEPSPLAPSLAKLEPSLKEPPENGPLTKQQTVYRALASVFPRTLRLLKTNYPSVLEALAAELGNNSSIFEKFGILCQAYEESELTTDEKAVFDDTYRVEKARKELDFGIRGDRYLSLKLEYDCSNNRQSLEILSEKKLLSKKLVLVPEARVLESAYRWRRNDARRLVFEKITTYCLHHQRPFGVFEAALPEFNYLVLSGFRKPTKVKVVLKKLLNQLSPKSEEERQKVIRTSLDQVKEAMRNGLLCSTGILR